MSYHSQENSAITDPGAIALDPGTRPHRHHIGRAWVGNAIELRCRCKKAACGLVDTAFIDPSCEEHAFRFTKTMRQIHHHLDCPCKEA